MNPFFIALIIAIAINIYLTYLFWAYWKKRFQGKLPSQKLELRQRYLDLAGRIKSSVFSLINAVNTRKSTIFNLSIELGLIALWAIVVGKPYLNFDPAIIPSGFEFSNNIQLHHTWTRALDCGWCALWNGSVAGGYPAFTDLYGSTLHPIVIITTLLFGVLSATKISLVITFFIAGLAQWWLAHELKLGRIARLWSAGIAVAAGHTTGKMDLGAFGMAFSIAMVSLIFASILAVYNGKGKKYVVLLGIVGASAILSGQGYIQAGFIGTTPALLILIFDKRGKIRNVWKDYCVAIVIACLLAAPLIVPFLNFSPNFQKGSDHEFAIAQAFKYIPLNLVINDWPYYVTEGILEKSPFPALDNIYIGWVPVILALIGVSSIKSEHRVFATYMASVIILIFLFASGTSLYWLAQFFPEVENVRFPNHTSGLSVPLVLGFSAYGLNHLLSLDLPTIQWKKDFVISTKFFIIIPLLISMLSVYQFSKYSIKTNVLEEHVFLILTSLQTNDTQWVGPPYGEQYFMEAAIATGLKVSPGIMPWVWRDREPPRPSIEACREGSWDGYQLISDIDGTGIYANPNEIYAAITTAQGVVIPCFAKGTGGTIQVNCETETSGILVVKENYFSGWEVRMNEQPIPLIEKGYWLAANAPAGRNIFIFRYMPWDVPLGIALSFIGIFLCFRIWMQDSPNSKRNIKQEHPRVL